MKRTGILLILFVLFLGVTLSGNAQNIQSPRDGVFDKIHTPDKKPIPYTPVREADVIYQKWIWRIIDLRQKINQPFYFPEIPQKGWRNFMTVILDALREGTLTAYDASTDDQFLVPLTYAEIESKHSKIDTVEILDPENPQRVLRRDIVKESLNPNDIFRIKLKEVWFFDKQRSVMDVRIIGICPVKVIYDEKGNDTGLLEDLFWIYFPEARPIFAKAEVFNLHNSAERRTYDDVFWKRMFGSYIYKEENVYNREISKYAMGMDALLESERIKMEIFDFEHDLWEF
jgi:gliding motility associated protien GldN